jgi:hypothetical protein
MTKEQFLTVAQWIVDGACEFDAHGGWAATQGATMAYEFSRYRRKPEPKLRPWKASERPEALHYIFRHKHGLEHEFYRPLTMDKVGMMFHGHAVFHVAWDVLFCAWEHKVHGANVWLDCGTLE